MIDEHKVVMFEMLNVLREYKKLSAKEVRQHVLKAFSINKDDLEFKQANIDISFGFAYFVSKKQVKNLSEDEKLIKRIKRGVYEITTTGEKLMQSTDARDKFSKWYDNFYRGKKFKQHI